MKILITLPISLCLTAPAWALSYTGSAQFDWSSLTFSGAGFTEEPHFYQQSALILDVAIPAPCPIEAKFCAPMPAFTKAEEGFSQIGLAERTVTASLPTVGTAFSLSTADSLLASAEVFGVGFAQSDVEWNTLLRPTESGPLTISIGYTLSHQNVPLTIGEIPDFWAASRTQLILTTNTGAFDVALAELHATTGSSSAHGWGTELLEYPHEPGGESPRSGCAVRPRTCHTLVAGTGVRGAGGRHGVDATSAGLSLTVVAPRPFQPIYGGLS
ncbi:MAG: hypothetical protein ABIO96_06600 [Nitrospiraceae bacterium]